LIEGERRKGESGTIPFIKKEKRNFKKKGPRIFSFESPLRRRKGERFLGKRGEDFLLWGEKKEQIKEKRTTTTKGNSPREKKNKATSREKEKGG